MAQTTKKKTVTVKDLNEVVTKRTKDIVILLNLVKDLDEKVKAINEDFDTRNKIKHPEQKVSALVTENRAKEKKIEKNLARY